MRWWGSPSEKINTWWERLPEERYWLDVTSRNDRHTRLAAPRGNRKSSGSWTHQLIRHVRGGDLVFHFDQMRDAIVAWSIAMGTVEKTRLLWPLPVWAGDDVTSRSLSSWAIDLRHSTTIDAEVRLSEVARTQSSLFPALCALESQAGGPLYYPFDMGNSEVTRLLPGYVFKLPALFVQGVPELANAARQVALSPIVGRIRRRTVRERLQPNLRESNVGAGNVMQGSV